MARSAFIGPPPGIAGRSAPDLAGCRAAAPSLGGQPIGTGWNSTPHRACTERVAGLYTPRCPIADHQDIHIKPRARVAASSTTINPPPGTGATDQLPTAVDHPTYMILTASSVSDHRR